MEEIDEEKEWKIRGQLMNRLRDEVHELMGCAKAHEKMVKRGMFLPKKNTNNDTISLQDKITMRLLREQVESLQIENEEMINGRKEMMKERKEKKDENQKDMEKVLHEKKEIMQDMECLKQEKEQVMHDFECLKQEHTNYLEEKAMLMSENQIQDKIEKDLASVQHHHEDDIEKSTALYKQGISTLTLQISTNEARHAEELQALKMDVERRLQSPKIKVSSSSTTSTSTSSTICQHKKAIIQAVRMLTQKTSENKNTSNEVIPLIDLIKQVCESLNLSLEENTKEISIPSKKPSTLTVEIPKKKSLLTRKMSLLSPSRKTSSSSSSPQKISLPRQATASLLRLSPSKGSPKTILDPLTEDVLQVAIRSNERLPINHETTMDFLHSIPMFQVKILFIYYFVLYPM